MRHTARLLAQATRSGQACFGSSKDQTAGAFEGASHGPGNMVLGEPVPVVRFLTCRTPCACYSFALEQGQFCVHGERRDESLQIVTSLSRGYEESMDAELQELFNFAIKKGVTLFDTADSYGESFAQVFCSSTWPVDVLHRLTKPFFASIRSADIERYMTEQIRVALIEHTALHLQALGV